MALFPVACGVGVLAGLAVRHWPRDPEARDRVTRRALLGLSAVGIAVGYGAIVASCTLLSAGCGGSAFLAGLTSPDLDAAQGDVTPPQDAAADSLSTTPEAALDAPEPHDGGRDAPPGDAPDPLVACETYYHAVASGCACWLAVDAAPGPEGPCSHLQWDDAGGLDCTHADLGRCEAVCGFDGGAAEDVTSVCQCIAQCLGTCAPSNEAYFACRVAGCNEQNCP